jgi:O-antigen ligase
MTRYAGNESGGGQGFAMPSRRSDVRQEHRRGRRGDGGRFGGLRGEPPERRGFIREDWLEAWRDAWNPANQIQTAVFACALLLLITATLFGGASQTNALSLAAVEVASLPMLFVGLYLVLAGTAPKGSLLPLILLAFVAAVPILQIIPLPASIWTRLPGREPIVHIMDVTRLGRPSLPFSMAPQETWRMMLALTPPAAMFVGGLFLTNYHRRVMAGCWLVLAVVSLGVGILQLVQGADSRFYFYEVTNTGALVGLFSNRNNEAAFFYSLMPFAAVFAARFTGDFRDSRSIPALLAVLFFAVAIVGVGGTRSRAGIAITFMALLGSAAVIVRGGALRHHWRAALGVGSGSVIAIGTVLVFGLSPILERFSASGEETRFLGWPIVLGQIQKFLPLGSGLGSFQTVYLAAEPLNQISPSYFNHAHNDYFELLLETGYVGVALFIVFLLWFLERIARIWTARSDSMAAASTVVVLGLMTHSLVEYPLRTEALAVLFAFACSTMAVWHEEERSARPDEPQAADASVQLDANASADSRAKTHRRFQHRRREG